MKLCPGLGTLRLLLLLQRVSTSYEYLHTPPSGIIHLSAAEGSYYNLLTVMRSSFVIFPLSFLMHNSTHDVKPCPNSSIPPKE